MSLKMNNMSIVDMVVKIEHAGRNYRFIRFVDSRPGRPIKAIFVGGNSRLVLAKFETTDNATREIAGYEIMRGIISDEHLPELLFCVYGETMTALVFEYFEHSVLLTSFLQTASQSTQARLSPIDALFSIVLKDCHWGTVHAGLLKLQIPPPPVDRPTWNEHIIHLTASLRILMDGIVVPVGVAHRDLHPNNVLVTGNTPVLLDFERVSSSGCPYEDYARLEVFYQLHFSNDSIWSIVVPPLYNKCFTKEKSSFLSYYIQEIRVILMKNSHAHFSATTMNKTWEVYLIIILRELLWVMSKSNFPDIARQRAFKLSQLVLDHISVCRRQRPVNFFQKPVAMYGI